MIRRCSRIPVNKPVMQKCESPIIHGANALSLACCMDKSLSACGGKLIGKACDRSVDLSVIHHQRWPPMDYLIALGAGAYQEQSALLANPDVILGTGAVRLCVVDGIDADPVIKPELRTSWMAGSHSATVLCRLIRRRPRAWALTAIIPRRHPVRLKWSYNGTLSACLVATSLDPAEAG